MAFLLLLNDYGYNADILQGAGIAWGLSPLVCT